MSTQDSLQLPKELQWEYAALTWSRTAGWFGTLGANETLSWSSTLEDEGEVSFQQSPSDLLHRIGRAGWELTSSTTTSNVRGGTTHEMVVLFVFKQRVASSLEHALAQFINPVALLKWAIGNMQKNPALARQVLDRALSFEPQQHELYLLARGRTYLLMGDGERALENFGRAIQASEQCGEAYWERGNIVLKRGDYENAITDYTQALRLIKEDYSSPPSVIAMLSEARYFRASAYSRVGRVKDAIKDFKEYLSRTRDDSTPSVTSRRSEVESLIKELERRK
jgi:tetratricopeptide (TPR) repeat protein